MAFAPESSRKNIDASALTAGGVGLKKGPSKEELKRRTEEEKMALEEERVYRRGVASIKDLIAPASMKIEPSFVRLGDICCRTIFRS